MTANPPYVVDVTAITVLSCKYIISLALLKPRFGARLHQLQSFRGTRGKQGFVTNAARAITRKCPFLPVLLVCQRILPVQNSIPRQAFLSLLSDGAIMSDLPSGFAVRREDNCGSLNKCNDPTKLGFVACCPSSSTCHTKKGDSNTYVWRYNFPNPPFLSFTPARDGD